METFERDLLEYKLLLLGVSTRSDCWELCMIDGVSSEKNFFFKLMKCFIDVDGSKCN